MKTDNNTEKKNFAADFKERVSQVRPTRWARFGVVTLLFILLIIWTAWWWLLPVWFILFDIYITGYIPLTFWKKSNNKAFRTIMSWVDAIVYALVLVYLIYIFIGQNFKIPSSSLEKTLLVGDYLWVSKMVYGPRIPQTPAHFPLAQHTLPIVNTKSYIETPQLEYRRLQGLRDVERGDIVVFNYPQGDTVVVDREHPEIVDYYQIVGMLQNQGVKDPRGLINANTYRFSTPIWRPVDRREPYVKRTIGLPGERLKIVDDVIYINGKKIDNPKNVQFNYIIPVTAEIPLEVWQEIGIRAEDHGAAPFVSQDNMLFYDVPLTAEAKAKVEKLPQVKGELIRESDYYDLTGDYSIFPMYNPYKWSRNNMGEIWIPKKGKTLHLTAKNLPMYRRAIETYEGNDLEVKGDGKIYINGKETEYYTFKLDYYWMMGDNRDRSADSRYWGFVPEDHIIGTPMFIFASFDEEKPLMQSMRWNRIFRAANPDK